MIHLLVLGKYKDTHLESLEQSYLKRFQHLKVTIHEMKSHSESPEQESLLLQKKILQLGATLAEITLLDERGKTFSSKDLAQYIQNKQTHYFAIGGAKGFTDELKMQCQRLSLSQLTLPHKFARLLFVEQLYRAQTLLTGHPYHND